MATSLLPTILSVEDDSGIQELLSFTLENAGYKTICAWSAEEAQNIVSDILPDLVILDWMLPEKSGLQLAKQWRSMPRTRDLPIIMVTARGEEQDKIAGLSYGADDYIVKPFSPKELIARVKAVLRRRSPELANEVLTNGLLTINLATYEAFIDGHLISLAPVEFKLLRFLMTNLGRVYQRSQLLDQVWGDHVYVEERTVDVHIRRLRIALGASCEHLIETVRGAGYKMVSNSIAVSKQNLG